MNLIREKANPRLKLGLFVKLLFVILFLSLLPASVGMFLLGFSYEGLIARLQAEPPLSPQELIEQLNDTRLLVFFTSSIIFLLVVAGSIIFVRYFSDRLKILVQSILRMSKGDFNIHLAEQGEDELTEVARSLNQLAQSLAAIRTREESIARVKTEFISIAAHQLRTPLAAIKWTFKMLLDGDLGKLSEEQLDFLKRGYDSNERMIRLVSDLLDASRIEEGRFGYQFQKEDIVEILNQVIEEHQPLIKQRGHELIFSLPKEAIPPLMVDSQRLSLAFSNIISNAINYTLPGGKITISLELKNKDVLITFADTGVGIPKHQMDRLFDKFFRADNVIRMQTEGSGLGLFITRNIIVRHGGTIRAESEEGKGTTFFVTLPLEPTRIPITESPFVGSAV